MKVFNCIKSYWIQKKKKNDFIEISSYKNINFLTNILSHLN